MDKATRLIRWQRHLLVLLFAALFLCMMNLWQYRQQLKGVTRAYRVQSEMRQQDKRIIRDAMERLDQYEAKYGPLPRQGEGVLIGKLGLREHPPIETEAAAAVKEAVEAVGALKAAGDVR
ncbi:MAG: hypothetical protein V4671_06395 [Armatimonadota bacterium]